MLKNMNLLLYCILDEGQWVRLYNLYERINKYRNKSFWQKTYEILNMLHIINKTKIKEVLH